MQDMHRRPQNHHETSERPTQRYKQRPNNIDTEEIHERETLLPKDTRTEREEHRTATKEPQS